MSKTLESLKMASSVALGIFDGVHLGHQEIIYSAINEAKKLNLESVVLTFKNHPRSLTIKNTPLLITDYESRENLFFSLGIEKVFGLNFSLDIMNMSPDEYLEKYLIHTLNAKSISVGYDHHFGKNRSGNVALLKDFCKKNDISLNISQEFKINGETVSSSAIRKYLSKGNVKAANLLLGREFKLKGLVTHGEKRGRELGFPTANLKVSDELVRPAAGVYLCRVNLLQRNNAAKAKSSLKALVNIGVRPSFGENLMSSIEAHILEYSADLYDRELELEFIDKIRDEQRFPSKDALINAIQEDIKKAELISI